MRSTENRRRGKAEQNKAKNSFKTFPGLLTWAMSWKLY